jgi:spore coat polysaccharide biosynthesis protein SpsF
LNSDADYASNALERTYPRGLDTEVMSVSALENAWSEAREPFQREHVTPFLYQNPMRFNLLSVTADKDYSHHRWTLDVPEDLEFLRAVYSRQVGTIDLSWRDVLTILEREPQLVSINQNIKQKAL